MPMCNLVFCKRPYSNISVNLKAVKLNNGHLATGLCETNKSIGVDKVVDGIFGLIVDGLI